MGTKAVLELIRQRVAIARGGLVFGSLDDSMEDESNEPGNHRSRQRGDYPGYPPEIWTDADKRFDDNGGPLRAVRAGEVYGYGH